jgi:iron donor protein CyaY
VDDREFQTRAAQALDDLFRRLSSRADEYGFEADFNAGALTLEFEDPPAKFVVSPNSPVRQIWVSAHSRSFKLAWDEGKAAFVLPETGQTLAEMVSEAVGRQLGGQVSL